MDLQKTINFLRNSNSKCKKSNIKMSSKLNLLSTFIFETKYPLINKQENYNNIFIPKLSFRFSPNETKRSTEKNADYLQTIFLI